MSSYRAVFHNLPLPAILFSPQGAVLECNATARALFLAGKTARNEDLFKTGMEEDVAAFFAGGRERGTMERTLKPGGGRPLLCSVSLARVAGPSKEPMVIATCTDITSRSRNLEQIHRLAAIIDSANDAMLSMSLDGTILSANRSAAELYGYGRGELPGGSILRLVPAGLEGVMLRTLATLKETHQVIRLETLRRRKDGPVFAVSDTYSPIPSDDGVHAVSLVSRDITRRKEAEQALRNSHENLGRLLGETVSALSMTLEKRDLYTAGHQHKVARIACALGRELGLGTDELDSIHTASVLHDIGKICIPMAILSKPARLTRDEMGLVRSHPQNGLDIIKNIPFPSPVGAIIHQHHERMDGSGYPEGLMGEDIIPGARVVAVADVLEAMSAHRPYRPALGLDIALNEFGTHRGTRYDPEVCDAMMRLVDSDRITLNNGELELCQ